MATSDGPGRASRPCYPRDQAPAGQVRPRLGYRFAKADVEPGRLTHLVPVVLGVGLSPGQDIEQARQLE
jgi:hypothetical protein